MIKGTGERGIACYLIHLRRHFKATRISGHEQERCNENSIALDVVVLSNCGSGKYCTAWKIDKTLAWMIGDRGIRRDEGLALLGTSEPLDDLIKRNYQISQGQKAERRWGLS